MSGKKDGKKHGQDSGGGAVAAVTRHAAKFTHDDVSSSPPAPSPDIKLSSSSTPSSHGLFTPSPGLDAISLPSYVPSTGTQGWSRPVPAVGDSPGNLISFMGESPPTQPSSYEDAPRADCGWSLTKDAAAKSHLELASPPPGRRPMSIQFDMGFPPNANEAYKLANNSMASRRSSMHSPYARPRPTLYNPPPPHEPQPHFYSAPDLDLDLGRPQSGLKAGERGYYFGFDALPTPGTDHIPVRDNVVVAGYEGGLDVHYATRRGLERAARLRGLRGGVIQAKILPWISRDDRSDELPAIAVVINGPVISSAPDGHLAGGAHGARADDNSLPADNMGGAKSAPTIDAYQTTVEVFSLKTAKRLCVLLETPSTPVKSAISSSLFQPPLPTGAFHVRADDGVIVVSSGMTGECWVFRHMAVAPGQDLEFRCLGKLWTTLQQSHRDEHHAQDADRGWLPDPPRPRPQSAIMSLSGRWIAYCPATPSSQIALRAVVSVPVHGKSPGISSLTAPQLPAVNADVDLPISESVVNKILRDTTQVLNQGAKWVGKQGMQAWNNYWNPQVSQQPRSPPLCPQHWVGGSRHPDGAQFPPTHGTLMQPVSKDPGLVSILDIDGLSTSASLHPIATFAIPHGCSFLSFTPTGLGLFTASSKGDVQTLWDLMRVQFTKASPLQTSSTGPASLGGPRVRQVAQFSRMTVARIVDVAWARPNGERAAMVTERGTVHLLEMPASAFTWPPPRRRARPEDSKSNAAEATRTSAVFIASSALSSVRDVAKPLMNRPHRSSSQASQLTGARIVDHASHSSKVIVAGISHSLGKTGSALSHLRHNAENRVALPSAAVAPSSGCVVWIIGRRKYPRLFVLGDGLVRMFPVQKRQPRARGERRGSRLTRYTDFKLQNLPDDDIAPAVKCLIDQDENLDLADKDLNLGTLKVLDSRPRSVKQDILSPEASIPQAEIESSAPYQPFHTDRRVGLFEYTPPPRHDPPPTHLEPQLTVDIPSSTTPPYPPPSSPIPPASPALLPEFVVDERSSVEAPSATKPRRIQSKVLAAALHPSGDVYTDMAARTRGFGRKKKLAKKPHVSHPPTPPLVDDDTMAAVVSAEPSPRQTPTPWAFGTPIEVVKLDLGQPRASDEDCFDVATGDSRALPASAIERVLQHVGNNDEQIVVTTRRRRGGGHPPDTDEDGFFEDDCEVLDFADQRV